MGRITRLDPLVSSQIAAGEVIERPASAVKELVENSLDAGATRISIEFEDGGLALIRVSDNGIGMASEDAPLSVERFATSKLSTAGDLARISSLGFRGEALPSIASCSRLVLDTRTDGEESGTEVRVVGGVVRSVSEKGLPRGTTVTIQDLFFNTPARLRFVKSRASERQSIVDAVMRLALAWPKVAFALHTGGKAILATSGQGLQNAVADIFGPQDASRMVEIEAAAGAVSIVGVAGRPSLYRRQRDRQMFSVNGRPVKDSGLGWALDSAYAGLLPPKTHPMAVLDISLPPEEVDVNVHPTKSQVKFRDESAVKRALSRAVGAALSEGALGGPDARNASRATPLPPSRSWGIVRDSHSRGAEHPGGYKKELWFHGSHDYDSSGLGPSRPEELGLWAADDNDDSAPGWEYLGSVADTYLVASTGSSVLIVDKHALMESLTYRLMLSGQSGSQDLLMAEMVRLDPKEASKYEDFEEALAGIGFSCRLVGDKTVMVTSVPMVLGKPLDPGSLKDILSKLSSDQTLSSASPERLLDSARIETAACHASVRAREHLVSEEASALLLSLRQQPDARTCPHGRPVVRELTMREMGEFFGRTSHERQTRV